MPEQLNPNPELSSSQQPEFDAGFFTINYFSTTPEGFSVKTRNSLSRRDNDPDLTYPTHLALNNDQRDQLRGGMANEFFFALPKEFPEDKKPDVKEMFQLINDVSVLKRNDQIDSNYHDKLFKLQQLRTQLRPLFHEFNLSENLGLKVGIRNLKKEGSQLSIDIKPISYPMYAVASSPEDSPETLDLGAVTGTAAILITSDNKIILQHRSAKNSPYGDMPGASFAGMFDGEFERKLNPETGEQNIKTGKLKPITTEDIKKSSSEERQQEIALTDDDITDFRIIGESRDHIREHDEFLILAKTSLSSRQVAEKALNAPRTRKKLDDQGDFHFEENFITIEATPEAISTLLTKIKCPLPPTHAAAFVATGYNMVLEENGLEVADKWRDEMQQKIKENYKEMNSRVEEYYRLNPSELNNNKPGKPKRNPNGYEPYYTPQEQGLPALESELLRTGLVHSQS